MPKLTLTTVLSSLGSVGLFASRAFVTAFSVAAMLKWGPQIEWINETGLLQNIEDVPSWFTHDITVVILGVLAVLEIAANKSSDARAVMQEVDQFTKSVMAFVTVLATHGIISQYDAELMREITAFQEPLQAGIGDVGVGVIAAFFAAWGVWLASGARGTILGTVMDADPEDDTMIMWLFSWAEDLWAIFGAVLLVLFPLVMLGVTLVLLGVLALAQRWVKKREEKSKRPCGGCGESMYRSAVACPSCKEANPEVHRVNWLGQTTTELVDDAKGHPFSLMQRHRCPVCATHLQSRWAKQTCEGCGHELFAESIQVDAFIKSLDQRLPMVLLITAVLSFIPIIGLIPAVIVYRVQLVTPLRRYLSLRTSIPARWGLRLLLLTICWVQVIPGVGVIAIPLMALISYSVYRGLFRKQVRG